MGTNHPMKIKHLSKVARLHGEQKTAGLPAVDLCKSMHTNFDTFTHQLSRQPRNANQSPNEDQASDHGSMKKKNLASSAEPRFDLRRSTESGGWQWKASSYQAHADKASRRHSNFEKGFEQPCASCKYVCYQMLELSTCMDYRMSRLSFYSE